MWIETVDNEDFLRAVTPALTESNADALAAVVNERWTPQQLCQILRSDQNDVKKVACVVLGLVGDRRIERCLAVVLKHEDAHLNRLAEHALWSIWFRSGSTPAQRYFARGLAAMERDEPAEAVQWYCKSIQIDPEFAEAYNQCGIARFMVEDYHGAIEDCQRAVDLVPVHFGGLAGMGHCYAELGNITAAADCYHRALQVNPHLEAIAETLHGIESCMRVA